MCVGKASDRRLRSLPLSTRIMQNILVASSYILEDIPIWLRLTAFEERERWCQRCLEYSCLVGKTFRCHLLYIRGHNRQGVPSAFCCPLIRWLHLAAAGGMFRFSGSTSLMPSATNVAGLTFSAIYKQLWKLRSRSPA